MVKSVDPDGTTAVTEKKNEADEVLPFLNPVLHEKGEEEEEEKDHGDNAGEMTSPAPMIEENGILPNRTGNNDYFNITHQHKYIFGQANTQIPEIP